MKHETKSAFKDATAVPGIRPEHDVSQIATRGHVNAARMRAIGRGGVIPALVCAVLGVWALYDMRPSFRHHMPSASVAPAWIKESLTFDPATYYDLGGGLHGGPDMRWLADFKPKPESLTTAQFDALVQAVSSDMAATSDPTQWATVAALEVRPQITRLERIFSEHSGRLPTGIVGLPEGRGNVGLVIAHVAGQWAMTEVRGGECKHIWGHQAEGCSPIDPNSVPPDYVRRILLQLKPVEQPTDPKE